MRMIRMRIFRVYMVVAMGMSMRMTVTVIMAVVMMIVPFGLFFQSAQPGAKAVTEGAIINIRAGR
jgi:hypothetical protein